jgi:hypothetical protein
MISAFMDVLHSSLESTLVQPVCLVFLLLQLYIVHLVHVALCCLLLSLCIEIFHILLALFLFVLVIIVLIHLLVHTVLSTQIPACGIL